MISLDDLGFNLVSGLEGVAKNDESFVCPGFVATFCFLVALVVEDGDWV